MLTSRAMERLSALQALDVRLKNMTLEEKLEKIVAEEAHNAYLLHIDIARETGARSRIGITKRSRTSARPSMIA